MAWLDTAKLVRRQSMAPFLTAATYTPAAGGPFAVNVVFQADAEQAVIGDAGVPISVVRPVAEVHVDDFVADPLQGDTILIDSITYEIDEPEKEANGTGWLLVLRLVQP